MKVFEIQGDESVRILDGILYGFIADSATISVEDGAALLKVYDEDSDPKVTVGFPWGVKSQLYKDSVWRVVRHLISRDLEMLSGDVEALPVDSTDVTTGSFLQEMELFSHGGSIHTAFVDDLGEEYAVTAYCKNVNPELFGNAVLRSTLEMLFSYNKRNGIHPSDDRRRALGGVCAGHLDSAMGVYEQ